MIGVVVPAHNEEDTLDGCLRALQRAASHPALLGEAVAIVVVLDACDDGSAAIARRHAVQVTSVSARCVGAARHAGACALLAQGARWLAFTDADSLVSESWLVDHLALEADAVCGVVSVADWESHAPQVQARYAAHYHDADGHRHIHGANLGVSAAAYVQAGGFPALALSEDVALVQALVAQGARIAWSARPRVVTSARVRVRARGGFGDFLLSLADPVPVADAPG